MQKEEASSKVPFNEIPIEQSMLVRKEFLVSVEDREPEEEITKFFIKFFKALQKEADQKFPGPERDLWFHFQLIRSYVDAEMWPEAVIAVYDALGMGQEQEIFSRLLDKKKL